MLPSSETKPSTMRKLFTDLVTLHALLLHFLRQERRGQRHLVLHLHLRDVRIRAAFEGDRDRAPCPRRCSADSM